MAGNIYLKEAAAVTLESSGDSLVNGSELLAETTFDNRSGGNGAQSLWANFELNGGLGTGVAEGTIYAELYLVPALDGTNYAEMDATNHKFQSNCFVGSFVVNKNQTGAQRMVILGVPLQPLLYKVYILNKSGQTISSTWTLIVVPVMQQYS